MNRARFKRRLFDDIETCLEDEDDGKSFMTYWELVKEHVDDVAAAEDAHSEDSDEAIDDDSDQDDDIEG